MSPETNTHRSQLSAAAAAAISAVGIVAVPVPAQAKPMFPLAPACVQYGWPGNVVLQHTNGWRVHFAAAGPTVNEDDVTGNHPGVEASMWGTVIGEISGRSVDFTIHWNTGAVGYYTGTVGDDGIARGDTKDVKNPANMAAWNTAGPLQCIKTADPPAQQQAPPPKVPPPPPPPPPKETATVISATDIFDLPDGNGTPYLDANGVPIAKAPGKATLVKPDLCRTDWCKVVAPEVPPGVGWIYIGDGLGTYP